MSLRSRIRAFFSQGRVDDVTLESGLLPSTGASADGFGVGSYRTYDVQTQALRRAYTGKAASGCELVRAIIDSRTAIIGGEGISVEGPGAEALQAWLRQVGLLGYGWMQAIKGSELSGRIVWGLRKRAGQWPTLERATDAHAVVVDESGAYRKTADGQVPLPWKHVVYVATAGTDDPHGDTTPRAAIVLPQCEAYTQALRDMRQLGWYGARITPYFLTQDKAEARELTAQIKAQRWRIGMAYVGTAPLQVVTPGTGAHDVLALEMAACTRTISAVTALPVHWLGWADLLSNRAVAETMYETLIAGTAQERAAIEDGIWRMLVMAQELAVDSGAVLPGGVSRDFTVRVPLLSASNLLPMVQALSLALGDDVITEGEYRSFLPGLGPVKGVQSE